MYISPDVAIEEISFHLMYRQQQITTAEKLK